MHELYTGPRTDEWFLGCPAARVSGSLAAQGRVTAADLHSPTNPSGPWPLQIHVQLLPNRSVSVFLHAGISELSTLIIAANVGIGVVEIFRCAASGVGNGFSK